MKLSAIARRCGMKSHKHHYVHKGPETASGVFENVAKTSFTKYVHKNVVYISQWIINIINRDLDIFKRIKYSSCHLMAFLSVITWLPDDLRCFRNKCCVGLNYVRTVSRRRSSNRMREVEDVNCFSTPSASQMKNCTRYQQETPKGNWTSPQPAS